MKKATTYMPSPTTRTAMLAGITRIRRKSTAARFNLVAGGTASLASYPGASSPLNGGKRSVRRNT